MALANRAAAGAARRRLRGGEALENFVRAVAAANDGDDDGGTPWAPTSLTA